MPIENNPVNLESTFFLAFSKRMYWYIKQTGTTGAYLLLLYPSFYKTIPTKAVSLSIFTFCGKMAFYDAHNLFKGHLHYFCD